MITLWATGFLLGLGLGISIGQRVANSHWIDTWKRGIGNFCRNEIWFAIPEADYCKKFLTDN